MASNEAKIAGLDKTFRIHQEVKRYTLLDNSFAESSPGKFRLERALGDVSNKQSPKLKIVISNDFSKLKMSTTTGNGLKEINLFQNDKFEEEKDMLYAILFQLLEEHILEEI